MRLVFKRAQVVFSVLGYLLRQLGIGFKSVFKVADIVWISSGDYFFKFDKNTQLGMIAPIWADFPVDIKPGHTSFYLQLSSGYNERELIKELQSLSPQLLIFLRKLRQINVKVVGQGGTWQSTLTRTDGHGSSGETVIHLQQNDTLLRYIVTTHIAKTLPVEPKRPGVSESEILLAFPLDEGREPKLDPQQVYAFLPIREYGFEVSISVFLDLELIFTLSLYLVPSSSRLSPHRKSRRR